MERSVIWAAAILAAGLVVSSLIMYGGLAKLGRSVEAAGVNSRSSFSMPSQLQVVGGREGYGAESRQLPIRVQLEESEGSPRD